MNTWHRMVVAMALALATSAQANLGEDDANESTNPDWVAGKQAVEAQKWDTAVAHLSRAAEAEPNNADVRNWLGFAQRKLGNLDAAFAAYKEALNLDPRHKNAHEYIGEAYLMAGNLAGAEQHLAELQKLCTPIPCEQYRELKRAVDEYKKRK